MKTGDLVKFKKLDEGYMRFWDITYKVLDVSPSGRYVNITDGDKTMSSVLVTDLYVIEE